MFLLLQPTHSPHENIIRVFWKRLPQSLSTTITKNKNISKSGPFEVRIQIQKYNTEIIVDPTTTLSPRGLPLHYHKHEEYISTFLLIYSAKHLINTKPQSQKTF